MNFLFITHFSSVNMSSENGFWLKKMAVLFGSLWLCLLTLFGFISRVFFRVFKVNGFRRSNLNISDTTFGERDHDDASPTDKEALFKEAESDVCRTENSKNTDLDEKEANDFVFKFRFQTYEEFSKSNRHMYDIGSLENSDSEFFPISSKYEVLSTKSSNYLMEESQVEIPTFTVKELHTDFDDASFGDSGFLSRKDEAVAVREPSADDCYSGKDRLEKLENVLVKEKDYVNDVKFLSEKDFVDSDSDSHSGADSTVSSIDFSTTSRLISTSNDGFLSDKDFEETGGDLSEEDLNSEDLNLGYEPDDFDEELEQSDTQKPRIENSENEFQEFNPNGTEKEKPIEEDSADSGKMNSDDFSFSEETNGLESLWEHQELVEQLKMDLRKVRATGLPTILEEAESPKIMADLKPWKIDEKFLHGDVIDELHKFYRSYRERMRKLDILNYQKMYAIGFLQSKDPLKYFSNGGKSSTTTITSFLSQNLRLCRQKKSELDPMKKLIREIYSDLETVYVGQMCLSWEFIQWQYDKALDLWESEPYGLHQYNEVAGEFQQFQVILQRFIENEPFEGPRVENYVKNRCVTRNLLQVPVIREVKLREREKIRKDDDDDITITSDVLIEIIQESIRIVWRFIHADKDAKNNVTNNTILTCRKGSRAELQDPADSELLTEVQSNLQEKEKKLKEMIRGGNCILKRFKKRREEETTDQDLYFFSQVDMKLMSRVLNMSRITTDQLHWCRNKLSRINFQNRKLHVEPSFFLFPC